MLANERKILNFDDKESPEEESNVEKTLDPMAEETEKEGENEGKGSQEDSSDKNGDEGKSKKKGGSKGYIYIGLGLLVIFIVLKMVATVSPSIFGQKEDQNKTSSATHVEVEKNAKEVVDKGAELAATGKKPEGEIALDNAIATEEAKKIEYRRELISVISPEKLEIDILGEETEFKSDGVSYMAGEKIGNGFKIKRIETNIKNHNLGDIEIVTTIEKEGVEVIQFPMLLKDFYTFTFYNDAFSIASKKNERKIGITLPGEKLTSIFKLVKVDIGDAENIYTFSFKDKTVLSVKVLDSDIQ